MPLLEEKLTYSVIGAFFAAYNKLGEGFLESVYVNALSIELQRRGHHVGREVPVPVHYDGHIIGTFRVDLLVDRRLIVEVKAEPGPKGKFEKQLRNYLRCTELELGLLLTFGERPVHQRVIHTNSYKAFKFDPRLVPIVPADSAESAEAGAPAESAEAGTPTA